MEIARRRGDFAIAGVAAMVTLGDNDQCSHIRLTFCGVGETPVDASSAAELLVGHEITEAAIAEVAHAIQQVIEPAGSVHATADYQRHVAGCPHRTGAGDGKSAGAQWTLTCTTSRWR